MKVGNEQSVVYLVNMRPKQRKDSFKGYFTHNFLCLSHGKEPLFSEHSILICLTQGHWLLWTILPSEHTAKFWSLGVSSLYIPITHLGEHVLFLDLLTKQKSHSLSTWETYGELRQVIWLITRSCHKYYDQYQIETWLLLRKLISSFFPLQTHVTSVDRGYPLLYRSKQLNSDSKPAIPNQQNKNMGTNQKHPLWKAV